MINLIVGETWNRSILVLLMLGMGLLVTEAHMVSMVVVKMLWCDNGDVYVYDGEPTQGYVGDGGDTDG